MNSRILVFMVLFSLGAEAATNVRLKFAGPKGRVSIRHLELEEYLVGVLAGEMPSEWPLEALKAQAVVARSYVFAKMGERAVLDFDVDADTRDQVYTEPGSVRVNQRARLKWAVGATKGMILRNADRKPVIAYYHADCGGTTEQPSEVWNTKEKTLTTHDQGCPNSLNSNWTALLTRSEIERILGMEGVRRVTVEARNDSGRVSRISINGNATAQIYSGQTFRKTFGYRRIRSALFEVRQEEDGVWRFSGRGYGHGVGLCQWGTRNLALKRARFDQILHHYFPLAKLEKME